MEMLTSQGPSVQRPRCTQPLRRVVSSGGSSRLVLSTASRSLGVEPPKHYDTDLHRCMGFAAGKRGALPLSSPFLGSFRCINAK